jgi:hypothetical protein
MGRQYMWQRESNVYHDAHAWWSAPSRTAYPLRGLLPVCSAALDVVNWYLSDEKPTRRALCKRCKKLRKGAGSK